MKSKSNIAKLKSDKYVPIVTAEHPELDMKYVVSKVVRLGLKPLPPKASI